MKVKLIMACIIATVVFTACGTTKKQETDNTFPGDVVETVVEENKEETHTEEKEGTGGAVTLSEKEIVGEIIEDKYHITGVTTEAVNIIIPDELNGVPVGSIEGYVFALSNLESIVFPDSMESVGQAEFNGCENLKTVDFGKGLKYIGQMPFSGCNKLEKVSFPEGMKTFDDLTFFSCANLKEVYVPESAVEFGDNTPIIDPKTCPNAVVVTPEGSPAQKVCEERGVPVRTE